MNFYIDIALLLSYVFITYLYITHFRKFKDEMCKWSNTNLLFPSIVNYNSKKYSLIGYTKIDDNTFYITPPQLENIKSPHITSTKSNAEGTFIAYHVLRNEA